MGRITIRRVDIGNPLVREAINTLIDDCFPPDAWIGGAPRFTTGWWWVAFDRGKAVGFAGMVEATKTPNAVYLCCAGVLPSHRGKGLQRKLIRKRTEKAREQGYHTVVTETVDNPASATSLIREGFLPYHPVTPWGSSHATYWKLSL